MSFELRLCVKKVVREIEKISLMDYSFFQTTDFWYMSNEITSFYGDIREIIQQARQAAYSAVNSAMVAAYWQIGRRIVEEE